jgi:hypothetical protein
MIIGDLLNLPAAVLAAAATFLAGVVAAITVILTAFINARTANAVARETFRRARRAAMLDPFFHRMQDVAVIYQKLIAAGPEVVADLRKAAQEPPEILKQKLNDIIEQLTDLRNLLDNSRVSRETAAFAFFTTDQLLVDATTEWLKKNYDFLDLMRTNKGLTANPERLAKMTVAANEAMWEGVRLRALLEDAIVQPRPLWRRQSYRVLRSYKKKRSPPQERDPASTQFSQPS